MKEEEGRRMKEEGKEGRNFGGRRKGEKIHPSRRRKKAKDG